ncbi:acyl dehydratase [Tamaricihabitans halophyticus]|uniref:Acyl dehydratase n=1 Tax=Tamaricihabitans halophyticus TaxID=1262583 RepID=A0A4R2Q7Y2_9PSEU|nr:MaoC family dehydratase [Tamaricihabitans halophyticus]TCP45043.1 acyl dehydratase [Tamaricihabitans halophyticus]
MSTQFNEFQLSRKGNAFEDFTVGQVFDHHWGRTITEAAAELFSVNTCNWIPLYVNREFAVSEGHPDIPVNPAFLLCLSVGMSVEDLSEAGGPFLGVEEIVFHHPVYPGCTVYARSTVLETRASESRPDYGIVTWQTALRNGISGATVLTFSRTNLVRRRMPVHSS